MKNLLKFFLIPVSQILAVLCAFGLSGQIAAIYMLATNQVQEGQPIFMDELAPNLDDLIYRSIITTLLFIICACIAYKGKKYLSNIKD
ncbi:MAG: hypothetical protein HWE16_04895 [Gammaproteobacteria bacterium]|nr:hypothetical protein [Gammaproteobacteria bacterium]